MKKRFLKITALALALFFALSCSLTAFAFSPIDTQTKGSLSITYKTIDRFFENIDVKTYHIADVSPEGVFSLSDSFKGYNLNVNATSKTELNELLTTIESYIVADKIIPDYTAKTDENGNVTFSDITPGLYLTLEVKIDTISSTTFFDSFLSAVPSGDERDNYDLSVFPKSSTSDSSELDSSKNPINFKVVKLFKDYGYESERPEYIEVDILKNGVLEKTVKLSPQNNWCYTWKAPADNSTWHAVERNIPQNYNVSITTKNNTISITNTHTSNSSNPNIEEGKGLVQTGYVATLWPYMLATCFLGSLLLVISLWFKKESQ